MGLFLVFLCVFAVTTLNTMVMMVMFDLQPVEGFRYLLLLLSLVNTYALTFLVDNRFFIKGFKNKRIFLTNN